MQFISKHLFPLLLCLLGVILFTLSYEPSTYLLGWDNLQTDLSPWLGVKRAFFSSWQEYQSFGLVAGMGHAADLVRAFSISLLSLVIPKSFLRYGFHFSMVIVGALGMYRLLTIAGFSKEKRVFAFLGAIFYILNFNIIQMMFFPFEPFSVFVGLLPWQLWAFLRLISREKAQVKDWIILFVVNLLATPQGVAQQLFVVYMMLLALLFLGWLITHRSLLLIKRGTLILLFILSVNSFWLMPQVYFLATSGAVVRENKINQIATDDVLSSNMDKGNPKSFFAFEGFFYDRVNQDQQPLFRDWKSYREQPLINLLIYLITATSLLGILIKSKFRAAFILCYLLIIIALLSNTFPFITLNNLLRENTFINQIFRSPFTKFSIPYALIASYFFTVAISALAGNWRIRLRKISFSPVVLIAGVLLILQALPAFTTGYLAQEMKQELPQPYKEAIKYFKTIDKNKRIGLLPEYTFWGWYHNNWGYDGSGFLWYGIEQPMISRTFDVWSLTSENYFWELRTALEAEDSIAFQQVLEKYNVDYILLDSSLLPIVSGTKGIQYQALNQTLLQSPSLKKEKQWSYLTLYKVDHSYPVKNFISVAETLPNIGPRIALTNTDSAYQTFGSYQTDESLPYTAYFPFLDLTTQTQLANKEWGITETPASWFFTRTVPFSTEGYEIKTASNSAINLYQNNTSVKFIIPSVTDISGNLLSVQVPKLPIREFTPSETKLSYCKNEDGILETEISQNSLTVKSRRGAVGCFGFEDLSLDQRYGYLLKVVSSNQQGQELFFYALDKTKEQAYVEDRIKNPIEYYILGSKFTSGFGYGFTFQNTSYSTLPAVNTLSELGVYLLPYQELKDLMITRGEPQEAIFTDSFTAVKDNYYRYTVTLSQETPHTLVLQQAYHQGWHAYTVDQNNLLQRIVPFLFGNELKTHIAINNWANGWTVPQGESNTTVILLFLPQYLQYVGFVILFLFPLGALIRYLLRRG